MAERPGTPPAPSPGLPALPHTWRPRLGPVVACVVGALLLVTSLGMWVLLPADSRAAFSWPQRLTLALVLLAILGGLYGFVRTKASADERGLTITNVFRRHRLAWAQVLRVNFGPGDPWVQLDIDDGTTVSVMAIQSADGARSRAAAKEVAAMVADRSRTNHDS